MDYKKSKRLLLILAVVYWVLTIGIYAIAHEQFRTELVTGDSPASEFVIGEVVDGALLRQQITAPADVLQNLEIMTGTYDRDNSGSLTITVMDSAEAPITEMTIPVSELENNAYTLVPFAEEIAVTAGELLILELSSQGCASGNAITIYAGNTAGGSAPITPHLVSGTESIGTLCIRLNGYNHLTFYKVYWIIVAAAFLMLSCYVVCCWIAAKKGKSNPLVSLYTVYYRYSFLIKQLVSRDIKTKYKRSSLGMAWSIMNPLLTMSVQYVVFSTLFRSDIPNYPVYLLTGIVFFNFFSEALTLGMTSITGNASLIKKVYMPKYIYPVSRVLSSLVNFACALIPLFLVMLLTRTAFRPAMFLLVFDILCYLAFIIGMTLLLTTAMTFFQDTQFLWGVVSMMWQYITPVFYPETIIPVSFLPIYRLNPMYQFISFARTCIIDGVSPAPSAYFQCLICAMVILLLGVTVFRRHQNKFVLYL